ncbi:hypothetical protein [Brevundimonas naejangsanensis]|uniref:hypothetical protein n=1 Tax=Brevundimonas naejangsanensis TaxID=588932 RepID=UPI0026F2167E|nr:hypothetical protein [Brevundimonas naejangsanensis]
MTTPLTEEEARAMREQLAAYDAAQQEAAKAANRALLAPLTSIGLGGTEPLTCSLGDIVAAIRANATSLAAVDPGFPTYAFTILPVVERLDHKLRSLVTANAPTPAPEAPAEPVA